MPDPQVMPAYRTGSECKLFCRLLHYLGADGLFVLFQLIEDGVKHFT